jgi:hypothetical protein
MRPPAQRLIVAPALAAIGAASLASRKSALSARADLR